MSKSADILILGGGVIGLSVACELGRRGASVTVLDAAAPGRASTAAAGMLAPLAEAAAPGPFLEFALESLRRYPDFVAHLSELSGQKLRICGPGMLRVARTEDEEATLCRAFAWQSSLGLPLHRLSGAEVRRLEPAAATNIQAALLSPHERHIEPRQLLSALNEGCRRQEVEIVTAKVTGVQTKSGHALAVSTAQGRHSFGTLVLAGGAWSRGLGQYFGLPLPVTPLRGQILALGPQSPAPISHTLYTHGAYLVPRADGRIVVGATEEWAGFDAETTDDGIAGLRADAARLVPTLAGWPLHSAWAGLRSVSADGLPLLGRAPGWDNVQVATGHGRNGILMAPLTGALMADALLHNASLPTAFDPARFRGAE